MTQVIYGFSNDCGDGSTRTSWFRDSDLVNMLQDASSGLPEWLLEGYLSGTVYTLTFPDDLDLEQCGFSFSDNDILSYVDDEEAADDTEETVV